MWLQTVARAVRPVFAAGGVWELVGSKWSDEQISLKHNLDRMKEAQNDIFKLAVGSIAAVPSSLFVETLRTQGL